MQIQVRRRNTAPAGAPTTLASGELAYDAIGNTLYIGQGDNGSGLATAITKVAGAGAFVLSALVGAAGGVASLDGSGKVPVAQIPASLIGGLNYQGTWNPNTNTPQLLSGVGTKGYYYKVTNASVPVAATLASSAASGATTLSVSSATGITVGQLVTGTNIQAGTTVTNVSGTTITLSQATSGTINGGTSLTFSPYLDGVTTFYVGDLVAYNGTTWDKIDGTAAEVLSVAGRTGVVTLTVSDVSGAAPLASPAFTGVPSAPTPAPGDNGTTLATTGFVAASYAPLASPALTGNPTAPTQAATDNSTRLATTAYVTSALAAGIKRTSVADAAYTVLTSDRLVAYTSLTGPRTVTLPAASSYPTGALLTIVDESGACSATNVITVTRAGTDTINGATSYALNAAYGYVSLESNGANKWTLLDTPVTVTSVAGRTGAVTLSSTDLTDSTAVGRALLTAASVAAQRGLLGIDSQTTVADAAYTVLTTDRSVQYTTLTAARALTLPAASSFSAGQRVTIGDSAGSCSNTNTLTITRAGSDTINGATNYAMTQAYSQVTLEALASGKWTVVGASIPIVDGGSF